MISTVEAITYASETCKAVNDGHHAAFTEQIRTNDSTSTGAGVHR
jgi:hypothetical protein